MEKIREALAKARTDKKFREQHPVTNAPEVAHTAGKPLGGCSDLVPPEQIIPSPSDPMRDHSPSGGEPAKTYMLSVDPEQESATSSMPAPVSTSSPGSRAQWMRDAVTQARAAALSGDPQVSALPSKSAKAEPTADKDSAEVLAVPTGLEEQVAVTTNRQSGSDDTTQAEENGNAGMSSDVPAVPLLQDGEIKWRSWPARHPIVASIFAVLVGVWSYHTFMSPLDGYVAEAEGQLTPILSEIQSAVGPVIDKMLGAVSEGWLSMVEAAKKALE